MSISDYNMSVTSGSASGFGAGASTTLSSLTQVKELNISYSRAIIKGRSDDSDYDTIFDVVNGNYVIDIAFRSLNGALDWLSAKIIDEAIFTLYSPDGTPGCRIMVENAAVERFTSNNAWGELAMSRISMFASRVRIGDGDDSKISLRGKDPLEGEWSLRRGVNAVNAPSEDDTVNYWDNGGL